MRLYVSPIRHDLYIPAAAVRAHKPPMAGNPQEYDVVGQAQLVEGYLAVVAAPQADASRGEPAHSHGAEGANRRGRAFGLVAAWHGGIMQSHWRASPVEDWARRKEDVTAAVPLEVAVLNKRLNDGRVVPRARYKMASAALSAAKNDDASNLEKAKLLLSENDPEGALRPASQAVEADPQSSAALIAYAQVLRRLGRTREAKEALLSALRVDSDNVDALIEMGEVTQDLNEPTESQSYFEKAIANSPQDSRAYDGLGYLQRQLGRPSDAAESFKQAHALYEPYLVLKQPENSFLRTVDTGIRYAKAAKDIATWRAGVTLKEGAWNRYRLLHQATNGRSSDFFSRYVGSKYSEKELWHQSTLFPNINEADLAGINSALDRDGLYIFEQPIDAAVMDQITSFATSNPARLYPWPKERLEIFNTKRPLTSGYMFPQESLTPHPVFQLIMGDPLLRRIAKDYLKVDPVLASITLWWSAKFERNPTSFLAQLFHADLAHLKWLKVFVHCTDVREGTGQHSFVKGTHKSDQEGFELRKRGLVRYSDEDVHRIFGDRIVDLIGPRGTVFIADTRGFHKGHSPTMDHRLMLQLYIVNSLYQADLKHKKIEIEAKDASFARMRREHPGYFASYV